MRLPFGKYKEELIHISEVQSGRTDLICPSCGQSLIAKKGKLKEHHFAHDGISCTATVSKELFGLNNRLPTKLPLCIYAQRKKEAIEKKLNNWQTEYAKGQKQTARVAELLGRLEKLKQYFQQQHNSSQIALVEKITGQVQQYTHQKIAPFPSFHLLRDPVFKTGYTDGQQKIASADWNEAQHDYFYPLVFQPYIECLQTYSSPSKLVPIKEQIEVYQQELARFQQFQLYFLEIQIPTATIHKIGLTTRPMAIRLKEIQQDLHRYFHTVTCKVLLQKKRVGFLENFFKRKYAPYQFTIGSLTEYFQFPPAFFEWVLRDLECVDTLAMPKRSSSTWVFWAFFHSNGKLYGGKQKYLFVDDKKYLLTSEETAKIRNKIG